MFEGHPHMWGMHWAWWIFWILLVAGLVWAMARSGGHPAQTEPRRETPLETLQRRYAEGEITTDEYEERKRRLES